MSRDIRLIYYCEDNECIIMYENGNIILPKIVEYKEEYKENPKRLIAKLTDDGILFVKPDEKRIQMEDMENLSRGYELIENKWNECMRDISPISIDSMLELISIYLGNKNRWKTFYFKKEDFIKDLMITTLDFLIGVANETNGQNWAKRFEQQQYQLKLEGLIGLPLQFQISLRPFFCDNMDYVLSFYKSYFGIDNKPIKMEEIIEMK